VGAVLGAREQGSSVVLSRDSGTVGPARPLRAGGITYAKQVPCYAMTRPGQAGTAGAAGSPQADRECFRHDSVTIQQIRVCRSQRR